MIWLPPSRRTLRPAQFVYVDQAASLSSGLVGAYILNASNGLTVKDAARKADGAATVTWAAGREGRAASFNPSTVTFTAGGIPGFTATTPISGACRWNCTSAGNLTIAAQFTLNVSGGWVLRINGNTAGTFDFFVAGATGGAGRQRFTNATFNDGKWHTGIFTYDGSNTVGGIHLYVDSSSEQAATTGVNSSPGSISGGVLSVGTLLGVGQSYLGLLDFLYLWNRVLLPAEIAAILRNPWAVLVPPPTGVRAAWPIPPSATAGKAWAKSGTFAAKSAKVRVSGSFATMPVKVRVGGSFITSK